jgi:hypothetical protein
MFMIDGEQTNATVHFIILIVKDTRTNIYLVIIPVLFWKTV